VENAIFEVSDFLAKARQADLKKNLHFEYFCFFGKTSAGQKLKKFIFRTLRDFWPRQPRSILNFCDFWSRQVEPSMKKIPFLTFLIHYGALNA